MSEVDKDIDVDLGCKILVSRAHNVTMKYLANPGRVIQHIRRSIDYVTNGDISV